MGISQHYANVPKSVTTNSSTNTVTTATNKKSLKDYTSVEQYKTDNDPTLNEYKNQLKQLQERYKNEKDTDIKKVLQETIQKQQELIDTTEMLIKPIEKSEVKYS